MDAPLLLKCGEAIEPAEHFGLYQQTDKSTAEKSGLSQDWEHYSQAHAHELTSHLLRRARSESEKNWNEYSKQFRDIWEDIMLPKITYGLARAKLHPELEAAIHVALVNRGVLIAPFHNMMLVSPETKKEQVDRLVAAFGDIAERLAA